MNREEGHGFVTCLSSVGKMHRPLSVFGGDSNDISCQFATGARASRVNRSDGGFQPQVGVFLHGFLCLKSQLGP